MERLLVLLTLLYAAINTGYSLQCYKQTFSDHNKTKFTCQAEGDVCYSGKASITESQGENAITLNVDLFDCMLRSTCQNYLCRNLIKEMAAENLTVTSCNAQCCVKDLCNKNLPTGNSASRVGVFAAVIYAAVFFFILFCE